MITSATVSVLVDIPAAVPALIAVPTIILVIIPALGVIPAALSALIIASLIT
jgi:hypothetical protein